MDSRAARGGECAAADDSDTKQPNDLTRLGKAHILEVAALPKTRSDIARLELLDLCHVET